MLGGSIIIVPVIVVESTICGVQIPVSPEVCYSAHCREKTGARNPTTYVPVYRRAFDPCFSPEMCFLSNAYSEALLSALIILVGKLVVCTLICSKSAITLYSQRSIVTLHENVT